MLAEMPEVSELHPVPDAHVPVMRFKFNGVSIDLLYAKLSLWAIPEVNNIYKMSVTHSSYVHGEFIYHSSCMDGFAKSKELVRVVKDIIIAYLSLLACTFLVSTSIE